jgi:hypothetical protein
LSYYSYGIRVKLNLPSQRHDTSTYQETA